MNSLKLVTLDLDNTLWDVEKTIRAAEQELVQWLAQHAGAAHKIYSSSDMVELRNHLSRLRIEILFNVMRAAKYPADEARKLAEAAFEVFFAGRNRVVFFPHALEMLQTLSARYPIYALTNGNADTTRTGISQYLRGAISSAQVGASKPDPRMFQAALDQAGVQAHQCVHIGDHLDDDIKGANAVGMHSIWVNLHKTQSVDKTLQPRFEVTHLSEIVSTVASIESTLI